MTLKSGEIQLKNVTLDLKLLPLGSRDISADTVTITMGAAGTAGAETITISSSTSVTIPAGTGLSFLNSSGRAHVLITEDASVTSTPTAFSCAGLVKAIDNAATASFITGSLPLYGIQDFNIGDQPQEVDTTNMQSGFGMESALVRSDHTIDISGIQIIDDEALYSLIKPLAKSNALFGREVYAIAILPDGEMMRGAAKIKNYSESGNQSEVKRYSFQLQLQGQSFQYFSPHLYS